MRLLFEMDKKDYEYCTHRFVRNSARSIITRDGKIAMIHSLKYDYYKFPGGGIENGENPVEAMIRETREEAGLVVKPETVKEYGYVHRIQRSDMDSSECFVQDNYYYLCKAEPEAVRQNLDAYEAQETYTLEYVTPLMAIQKNRSVGASPYNPMMFEREIKSLYYHSPVFTTCQLIVLLFRLPNAICVPTDICLFVDFVPADVLYVAFFTAKISVVSAASMHRASARAVRRRRNPDCFFMVNPSFFSYF